MKMQICDLGEKAWCQCFTAILILSVGCSHESNVGNGRVKELPQYSATSADAPRQLGNVSMRIPSSNALTQEKIELGKRLFFDKNLSLDRSMSCATCHDPEKGWSNGQQFAVGVHGTVGNRNVPSILNSGFSVGMFWDGRARGLEAQALEPILNPDEMAMPSKEAIVKRILEDDVYHRMFARAFTDGINSRNVAYALASFERTVMSGDTPYDRYMSGDKSAMSEAAVRGLEIYRKKGRCALCHDEPLFTDNQYYNLGVSYHESSDLGRYTVTKLESAKGKFKTPLLRDVSKTAPYMHDGSMKSLEEVIEFYVKGGTRNPYLAENMRKLSLTEDEQKDLLQFLVEGLTTIADAQ